MLTDQYPEEETLQDTLNSDISKMAEAIAYYQRLDHLIDFIESDDLFIVVPINI